MKVEAFIHYLNTIMNLQVEQHMTEKANLLLHIESSLSSEWPKITKEKILSQYKKEKDFQKILTKAWVDQQLREAESDPLEEQVVDQSGEIVASRAWKCNAKNCSYQPSRGQRSQLAIQVTLEDSHKLTSDKKYVCLRHYRVNGQDNDYCHNFFKFNKKLPAGAFLNVKGFNTLPLSSQPSAEPQPSTSANQDGPINQVEDLSVNHLVELNECKKQLGIALDTISFLTNNFKIERERSQQKIQSQKEEIEKLKAGNISSFNSSKTKAFQMFATTQATVVFLKDYVCNKKIQVYKQSNNNDLFHI